MTTRKNNSTRAKTLINKNPLFTLLGNKPAGRHQHIYTQAMLVYFKAYNKREKVEIPSNMFCKFYKSVWPYHLKHGNIKKVVKDGKNFVVLTETGFNVFKAREARYNIDKAEIEGALQFFKDGKVDATSSPFKGAAYSPLKTIA